MKDAKHNINYKSQSRILQSHNDRAKTGNFLVEEQNSPRRAKGFKEDRVAHLYNSSGVLSGIGVGNNTMYSSQTAMKYEAKPDVYKS